MNRQPDNPIFIVFEGLDGSGKSTVARLVAEELGAVLLTTPSPAVREFRDELVASFGGCQEAAQLFYLSTVFDASQRATEILASGQSVVIDRYFLSTQAYAAFRGSSVNLDSTQEFLLAADVTVYLDVPLEVRTTRLAERGTSAADLETLTTEAQRELRNQHFGRAGLDVVGYILYATQVHMTPAQLAEALLEEALSGHVSYPPQDTRRASLEALFDLGLEPNAFLDISKLGRNAYERALFRAESTALLKEGAINRGDNLTPTPALRITPTGSEIVTANGWRTTW